MGTSVASSNERSELQMRIDLLAEQPQVAMSLSEAKVTRYRRLDSPEAQGAEGK